MKQGLLLINLGTPNEATPRSVRTFLRQFLTDGRVITLPWLIRYILVFLFILPFRTKKSTHAYQSIWMTQGTSPKGSPLRYFSQCQSSALQKKLGSTWNVALAMRYGEPSIKTALKQLQSCAQVTVLPLFPQYASSATGSACEQFFKDIAKKSIIPNLRIIRDFHDHPGYIHAYAELIKTHNIHNDYLLLSYHGVPESHLHLGGCPSVCEAECPSLATEKGCYRAQCLKTSQLIAKALKLKPEQYTSSFQSRLGRTPWIKPYTDIIMPELARQGIKNIAIVCPSFVSDCLETLEEIGLRAREEWASLGGNRFTLIPCLNDSVLWIDALEAIIQS